MGKKSQQDRTKGKLFKSNRKREGGTLKIFADDFHSITPYKTFVLSPTDTADWIIKQTLEKYGLKHEDPKNFCLIQILIPGDDQSERKPIKRIVLRDKDCPLQLCWNHYETNQGSTLFKLIRCSTELMKMREREHPEQRTLYESSPTLIEIEKDGHDLLAPRLVKILPDTTFIGRRNQTTDKEQTIFIDGVGIERDHAQIQNQRGIVTMIPKGETRCDGKLMTTPWILQHGARIQFGRSLTFRFYDPFVIYRSKSRLKTQKSIYHSLPILAENDDHSKISMPKEIINPKAKINVLPGLLEVPDQNEIPFLKAVFDNYPLTKLLFRLSPVYMLYMALRYRLSSWVKPMLTIEQKQENIVFFLTRIEDAIEKKFQECHNHVGYSVYWMANISELLFFLKYDRHLTDVSQALRVRLVDSLETIFYRFNDLIQIKLEKYYSALIDTRDYSQEIIFDDINSVNEAIWIVFDLDIPSTPTITDLVKHLSSLMTLLRKCRMNASMTIQIYSQLFASINVWLFNRIVCRTELALCSYACAEKILFRLRFLNRWAQTQGLEVIFDSHLAKVHQLCSLLLSPKRDVIDAQPFMFDKSWKLNSLQIRHVMNNYNYGHNEPAISQNFIKVVVSAATQHVDEDLRRTGNPIALGEHEDFRIPFSLPDDGYSCEMFRGIPDNLLDFIESISLLTSCRLYLNPYSLGYWTEFMYMTHVSRLNEASHRLETITLTKKDNSLGLSIVSAKSEAQNSNGIYIQEVFSGGVAAIDGRLEVGDQILAVDHRSLIDANQEEAATILRQNGPIVTLQVLKNAAQHQGLSNLLVQSNDIPNLFSRDRGQSKSSRDFGNQFYRNSISNRKHYETKLYQSNPTLTSNLQRASVIDRVVSAVPPLIQREDVPFRGPSPVISYFTRPKSTTLSGYYESNSNYRPTNTTTQYKTFLPSGTERDIKSPVLKVPNRKRDQRIRDLAGKINRTHEEDNELKCLKIQDEFERRFGHWSHRIDRSTPCLISSSPTASTNTTDAEERLRRRLEQYEHDRELERMNMNEMLVKHRLDAETRLRQEREKAKQADHELQDFQKRHMTEDERRLEAEREQKRLSKYITFPVNY